MEEQRKSESDMSREERSEAGDEIVFSQKEFGQKLRKYFWQHGPDKVHKGLAKIGEKMPCRAVPCLSHSVLDLVFLFLKYILRKLLTKRGCMRLISRWNRRLLDLLGSNW